MTVRLGARSSTSVPSPRQGAQGNNALRPNLSLNNHLAAPKGARDPDEHHHLRGGSGSSFGAKPSRPCKK
jgi:hypothetical protein